mgnify:CR=1 FL=1
MSMQQTVSQAHGPPSVTLATPVRYATHIPVPAAGSAMTKSARVPEAMQARFDSISAGTDAFCETFRLLRLAEMVMVKMNSSCQARPFVLYR